MTVKNNSMEIVSTIEVCGHNPEMTQGTETMTWQLLESKLLTSSAYNPENCILYLRFQSGDVYRYFDFPSEQYQQFLDAESRGRYFLAKIRNQFRYERLARLRAA